MVLLCRRLHSIYLIQDPRMAGCEDRCSAGSIDKISPVSEAEAMLDFCFRDIAVRYHFKGYHLVSSDDCVVIDRKGSCVNQ